MYTYIYIYTPISSLYLNLNEFVDLVNSFVDLGKSFVDLGKSFVDLGKSFVDLGKSFVDVGKFFVDLGQWVKWVWCVVRSLFGSFGELLEQIGAKRGFRKICAP